MRIFYNNLLIISALILFFTQLGLAQSNGKKLGKSSQVATHKMLSSNQQLSDILWSDKDFSAIVQEADAFFQKKHPNLSPAELCAGEHRDGAFVKYQRWKYFWERNLTPDGKKADLAVMSAERARSGGLSLRNASPYENVNWENISNSNYIGVQIGLGRTTSIGFHPTDPNIYYVGAAWGGVWKTTDGGNTYTPIGDKLPSLSVSSIVVDKNNPNTIYIAVSDHVWYGPPGLGIYKSTDGGNNWQPTSLAFSFTDNNRIYWMEASPSNPNIILVACDRGLYRTTDGFQSNQQILSNVGGITDIRFKPGDANTVYCTASNGSFYKSTDAGMSFSLVTTLNSGFGRIAVTPQNPNKVYVGYDNKTLFRSTNSGSSFAAPVTLPEGNAIITFSPQNQNTILAGNFEVHSSTNDGASFTPITHWLGEGGKPLIHVDQRNAFINPLQPNFIYWCNDGGVVRQTAGTSTFTDRSRGLIITQFYDIAVSQTQAEIVSGGSQDNGSMYRNSNGSWDDYEPTGDGMTTEIDHINSNIRYWCYQLGGLRRFENGTNVTISPPNEDGKGAWVTPFKIDPNNPSRIVAGYKKIYLSTNKGASWTAISNELQPGYPVNTLSIAPSNSNRIYATENTSLYIKDVSSNNWTKKSTPASFGITDIEVDHLDMNTIYITVSGYQSGGKVYKSTDAGSTWTNISDNLPNVPAACIELYKNVPGAMFVGTRAGVYYRDNTMTAWELYGNLPNTEAVDIEIQYSSNKVIVGTHGRGVYRAFLPGNLGGGGSSTNCTVAFTNTGCQTAELFWNNSSTLVSYGTIAANTTKSQGTFNGHAWVIKVGSTTVGNYTVNCSSPSYSFNAGGCSGGGGSTLECEARVNNGNWQILGSCAITVAAGQRLELGANPNGLSSYQWRGPNGFSGAGNGDGNILISSAITSSQAGDYIVTVNNNGTTSTKTIRVTVTGGTTLECEANVNNGGWQILGSCAVTVPVGQRLELGANPNGLSSYQWRGPNGFSGAGNGDGNILISSAITTSQAGDYIVTVNNNGSSSTKTIRVTVTGGTTLECEARVNNGNWQILGSCAITVAAGQRLELGANPNGLSSYQWRGPNGFNRAGDADGNILIADAITPSQAGDYIVTVNNNGSSSTKTIRVTVSGGGTSTFSATKCYRFNIRHSGKVMEVGGHSTVNGGNVQQWSWYGAKSQIWRIKDIGSGLYQIVNGNSGRVLDVAGVSTAAGANVHQWQWLNANNQKWKLMRNTEGYYVITAQHSGQALDVSGAGTQDGANIVQWPVSNGTNQQFQIAETACPAGTVALQSANILTAEGHRDGSKAVINWISNANQQADYFVVEKLNDKAQSFEKLALVNAKYSLTDDKNFYSITDNNPVEGENYYRIALYREGKTTPQYSELITVDFSHLTNYHLYPNPANDIVNIELEAVQNSEVTILITDLSGKIIQQTRFEAAPKSAQIAINDISNGQYFIHIDAKNRSKVVKKLAIIR